MPRYKKDLRKELKDLILWQLKQDKPNIRVIMEAIDLYTQDYCEGVIGEIREKIDTMVVMGKRRDQKRERPLLLWREVDDLLGKMEAKLRDKNRKGVR